MKKTRNIIRITGIFLTIVMLVALFGAMNLTASAAAGVYATGTLGQYDRTAWTIYDNGLLVIDGKGNTMTSEKWDSTTASPWKDYADVITKVTFVNCQNWKSLPAHSFKSLKNLKEITLPENLEVIQQLALGYTGIETIELPQSLTTIGESAFSNCKSLNYVNIHNGVTTIYAYAFSECENLKAISIPDTVTLMKGNVFAGCDNLEYVRLGSGISELSGSAFSGCNLLETLTIPSNVTTIGAKFLSNNASLEGVYYQGDVTPTTYATNVTSGTFYGIDKSIPIYTHTSYESDTIGIQSQYLNDVRTVTKIDGYFVNMAHSVGGAFKVDKSIVAVGDIVTVGIMAYKNYALDTFVVKGADGNEVTAVGEGSTRTFAMPAGDVTITATFKSTIVPHEHSWSFEVDGTRINATCANTDGMCHNPNQSVVITAPATKYFAWSQERTVTVSGTVEDVEVSDVVYTLKSTGEVARPFAPGVYVATTTVGGVAVTCEYEITKSDQLNYTFFTYVAPDNLTYDGTAKVATAVLSEDVAPYIGDIEVLYNGRKEAPVNEGEYAVTINVAESDYYSAKIGIVLKTGSGRQMKDAKFTIDAKDISDLTYDLEDSYPMNGEAVTPDVRIQYNGMTLVKDTDYTIAYANNTAPGTATMTITGIGNYTGSKTLNFEITEAICNHEEGIVLDNKCDLCGQDIFIFEGVVYDVLGDITNTGLYVTWYDSLHSVCYKAGDGYIVAEFEGYDGRIILYNATIDVSELEEVHAIYTDLYTLEYTIYGINNIYGNNYDAIFSSGGSGEDSEVVMNGIDGSVLNVYGGYSGNNLILNSITMNVYNIKEEYGVVAALDLNQKLTINEGATLNAMAGGSNISLNIGVWVKQGIENNGTLNAIVFGGYETENSVTYIFTVCGDAVLVSDTKNYFYGQDTDEFEVIVEFIVPKGATVTVPEGVTLDLDSMTKVDVQGKIIVEGTLICTHEGGEATCTDDAICDICKTSYIEAFGHEYDLAVTDPDCENGGYTTYTCNVCGYSHNADETEALGHDFEKGECTVCGEEDPDLNWFERIVYIIINFFKRVFEFLTKK